jgi:hypothetical protein
VLSRSKPVAWILVLLMLSGAVGSWHAGDDHEDDAGALLHDHSAHHERWAPPAQSAAPAHCALCHWLRAMGTGAPRDAHLARVDTLGLSVTTATVAHIRMSDRLNLPSRAPPRA